jgi:hypothetical protein
MSAHSIQILSFFSYRIACAFVLYIHSRCDLISKRDVWYIYTAAFTWEKYEKHPCINIILSRRMYTSRCLFWPCVLRFQATEWKNSSQKVPCVSYTVASHVKEIRKSLKHICVNRRVVCIMCVGISGKIFTLNNSFSYEIPQKWYR